MSVWNHVMGRAALWQWALGVLLLGSLAAPAQQEYKLWRADDVTRERQLEDNARDGWQLAVLAPSDRGYLALGARKLNAKEDLGTEYKFIQSRLGDLPAKLQKVSADGWDIVLITTKDNDQFVVTGHPKNRPRPTSNVNNQSEYKTLMLTSTLLPSDLDRLGRDGWSATQVFPAAQGGTAVLFERIKNATRISDRPDQQYRVERLGAVDLGPTVARQVEQGFTLVGVAYEDREYVGLFKKTSNRGALAMEAPKVEYKLVELVTASADRDLTKETDGGWNLQQMLYVQQSFKALLTRPTK